MAKNIFEVLEDSGWTLTKTGTSTTPTVYEKLLQTNKQIAGHDTLILTATIKPSVRNCASIAIKDGAVSKKLHMKLLQEESDAMTRIIETVVIKTFHLTTFDCK